MSNLTQKLNTISKKQDEINELTTNNEYKYVDIQELQRSPIDVGSMCNNEYYINSGYLEGTKFWEVEDTADMCFWNAQKMYTNIKWEENSLINNNIINKQPGLALREISSKGHLEEFVRIFKDTPIKQYISDFSIGINAGKSIELFGYFVPDITGTWSFSLPNTEIALLWITNDIAIYDFTKYNANINSSSVSNNNAKTYKIKLKKNEYYSIRIQLANLTQSTNTNPLLTVESPNQNIITQNSANHNYFVSLFHKNKAYMKKLLYFGLVQSDMRRKANQKLFQCIFMTNENNYETIDKLKVNEAKIYRSVDVPNTITYNSPVYNARSDDGSPINITSPVGSEIQIIESNYGLVEDRVENQPIPSIIPETDPAKTIKQDYTTYNYQQRYDSNQYRDANVQLTTSSFVDPKPTKTIYTDNYVVVPSSKDTTTINRSMVKGNQLVINGDYNSIYGDPAPGYNNKVVSINYRYNQSFDANDTTNGIKNKTLYLDGSGQLVIGYDYNGTTNSSVISFLNNADKCNDPNNCNYVLKLKDDGNLAIYNNLKTEIWSKKLADLPELSKILINTTWLNNPLRRSILNRGEKLSSSSIPELISENGKFKLKFENNKLIVKYSSPSYNEFNKIRYTDTSISDKGRQIYYLYRVAATGLNGKKFLVRKNINDENDNYDNSMWHLKNNSNEILKFSSYDYNTNTSNFPLLTATQYDTIVNNKNQSYIENNKYSVTNVSESNCKTSCQNNINCEHFYYINTSNGGRCMQDISSNSLPMFSSTNPTSGNVKTSYLGKKQYNIYTTCPNNLQAQQLNKGYAWSYYMDNNVVYNRSSINDHQYTYYCADDIYKDNNKTILDIYNNKSGFTTMEGMTTREGNSNLFDDTFNKLDKITSELQEKQEVVNNNYVSTIDYIKKHYSKTKLLDENELYNTNDANKIAFNTYYPLIYDSKPDTTIQDAIKNDTNTMILQQNTLYTIGTITAATLLIFAIVLARE
jgi:hypothetical protein